MSAPVLPVGAAGPAPAAAAPASGPLGALGGDAFLALLIEQMRAQDPTDPQSATDYVAQLATFAQVEQSVAIREAIGAALSPGGGPGLGDAAALIGHRVTGPGGAPTGVVASVAITAAGVEARTGEGAVIPLGPGAVIGPREGAGGPA